MSTERNNATTATGQELIITRFLDAPREFVWKAWTEPDRFMHWWGPREFTTSVSEMDFRVGGEYLTCMRSPDGQDYWSKGVYREIVEPERIVFTDSFSDEDGETVPASYYGMSGDWPMELLVTVTFEEYEGKTKLTLRHAGIPAGENRDMAAEGWNESFDKLAEYAASEIENLEC